MHRWLEVQKRPQIGEAGVAGNVPPFEGRRPTSGPEPCLLAPPAAPIGTGFSVYQAERYAGSKRNDSG